MFLFVSDWCLLFWCFVDLSLWVWWVWFRGFVCLGVCFSLGGFPGFAGFAILSLCSSCSGVSLAI